MSTLSKLKEKKTYNCVDSNKRLTETNSKLKKEMTNFEKHTEKKVKLRKK